MGSTNDPPITDELLSLDSGLPAGAHVCAASCGVGGDIFVHAGVFCRMTSLEAWPELPEGRLTAKSPLLVEVWPKW
jgi:hypothetical protein